MVISGNGKRVGWFVHTGALTGCIGGNRAHFSLPLAVSIGCVGGGLGCVPLAVFRWHFIIHHRSIHISVQYFYN